MDTLMAIGEVALQTLLALFTFRGFGEVLVAGQLISPQNGRFTHLYRTAAGLAASTLFLLAGVYAGIPVCYSAWVVLAVALAGLGLMFWRRHVEAPRPRRFACEERWAAGTFLAVLLLQGIPLFWIGPGHYFSAGKTDFLQYTVCTQFLVEESIHSLQSPPPLKPWFLTAGRVIDERLGQNMPAAYVTAILHSHAQRVIGTIMALYLAALAAAVFTCLRSLNVTMPFAVMGALLSGLAHFISYSSNCAFLSNASILFILPLLASILWRHRHASDSLRLLPALLLAYIFCCYTELSPFLMMSALLCWVGLLWPQRRVMLRPLGITALTALLMSTPYLTRAIPFLLKQFDHGANQTYLWHYDFAQKSGTWVGWKELFFANLEGRHVLWINHALMAISLIMMAAAFLGCLNGARLKRRYLGLLILGSGSYLVLLRLMPDFRIYAFFKLSVTYLPIFIIAIVYGLQTFSPVALHRQYLRTRLIQCGLLVIVLLALGSSALGWRQIILTSGTNPFDQAPNVLAIYDYVRRHPEKTYFITDRNYFRASWLIYNARSSKVYCAYALSHGLVSDELHPSILPPPSEPYVTLDGETVPTESATVR